MKSQNEWDTLRKVIVSVTDYATVPLIYTSVRTVNYADKTDTLNANSKRIKKTRNRVCNVTYASSAHPRRRISLCYL